VPKIEHEAPLEVLRHDPALVPLLLRNRIDVPEHERVEVIESVFTQAIPAELRADMVLCLKHHDEPVMGVVVEVQRRRDARKRRTWPLYVAALHARLECPTCLVVLATDESVERWAARPITTLHPGCVLTPIVVGPAQVPIGSERPWLAVLAALLHRNLPSEFAAAVAALTAVDRLPEPDGKLGINLILASLGAMGHRPLEPDMDAVRYFNERLFELKLQDKHLEPVRGVLRTLAKERIADIDISTIGFINDCMDAELLATVLRDVAASESAEGARRALAALAVPDDDDD
jgi:hypothetical protein